jgi:uncharacterized protein YjcR
MYKELSHKSEPDNNQRSFDLTPQFPLVPEAPPIKKKRGGQSGNHNARTHGLYSSALLAANITEFSQDVIERDIDPDVALVRATLRSVLLQAPSNRRALDDAAGMLARIYSEKLQLDKTNTRLLKRVFMAVIESCSLIIDCKKKKDVLQNESSVL